ncbi:MAG TPA: thiamine-phosphate kinase [Actinomycetota bacterium]|nr:thiamine-phosphate kinase [Actinomycetota bacterium]
MAGDARTVSEAGELELVARITARLAPPSWPRDDAAVVASPGDTLLCTTDALVEGVDFDFSYCTGADVGWKALAVNVSDVAAMGGAPAYAVAALSLRPDVAVAVVDEIVDGLEAAAARWGVAVVGGDVGEARDVALSVTVVGSPSATGPVGRSGARPGDALCVTGALGGAAGGLAALRALGRTAPAGAPRAVATALDRLRARHLRPEARVEEARALAGAGARAMIDVSDGLAVDLGHLTRASGTGCDVDRDAVPVDADLGAVGRMLPATRDALELPLLGGEDFELLAALPPERVGDARAALAHLGTELTAIGSITSGDAMLAGRPLEDWRRLGWEHLRRP